VANWDDGVCRARSRGGTNATAGASKSHETRRADGRWRGHPPCGRSLARPPAVRTVVGAATRRADGRWRGHPPCGRSLARPPAVRTVVGAACVVVLAGCGSTTAAAPRPSAGAPSASGHSAALKTCGRVTHSTGILRNVLQVHLSGPSRLVTGSLFNGTVTVSLRPGVKAKKVFLSSGAPILAVITQGTDVVGAYEGAVGGVGISATVTAGRPYHFPAYYGSASVLLRGCPDLPINPTAPDKSRKLLPPGRYLIYAYVDDMSGNDTSKYGALRSQPLTITVTTKAAS